MSCRLHVVHDLDRTVHFSKKNLSVWNAKGGTGCENDRSEQFADDEGEECSK